MTRNRSILILLFCMLGWCVHFWPTFHAANESIRFYFVQSVVDHGSAAIDPVRDTYGMNNIDRTEFEGRSYLDKAPGLSFLSMPMYWVLTRLGMSTDFQSLPPLYYLLHLMTVVVLSLLGVWWTRGLILSLTKNDNAAWAGALIFGMATPFAFYSTLFFGHAPAAALAIGSAFYLDKGRYTVAGVLAGAMVLVDTPTAILATGLGIWAGVRERSMRHLLLFGLGGLPLVTVQLAYNTWIFGSPWTFAYSMKATGDLAAIHQQGLYGFSLPTIDSLWGLTFGAKRGLFYHAPVLVIGFLSWRQWRALLTVVLVYFLWISGFVDWPAGDSYMTRHLVPLTPFLAVGVGLALANQPWCRWALGPLAVASFFMTWAAAITFPYAFQAFDAPVMELAVPMLAEGHFSPSIGRWIGLSDPLAMVPIVLFAGVIVFLQRPGPKLVAASLGGIVLIGLLYFITPVQTDSKVQSRIAAECLFGHDQVARDLCHSSDGNWHSRYCHCQFKKRK